MFNSHNKKEFKVLAGRASLLNLHIDHELTVDHNTTYNTFSFPHKMMLSLCYIVYLNVLCET